MSRTTCYVNGRVYVKFKPLIVEEALVVSYDRILYVGEESRALSICGILNGRVVDLNGKTVMPGFIDSHMHLDGLGFSLSTLDLRGARSIEEVKDRVKRYVEKYSPGTVLGRGWDQELFEEKRWPTRWDLDEVVGDRPVMLVRICGHAAVLNTKALELTGLLDSSSPWVYRDEKGTPTGIIVEEAVTTALERLQGSVSLEERVRLLKKALEYTASHGVTTVGFMSCGRDSLRALMSLLGEWRYPRVRVYVEPGLLDEAVKLGLRGGFGSRLLKIKGVKVFADGSLGARTAWLTKPYSDDPSSSGRQLITREKLLEVARRASEAGFQVAVHGIGDAAIDLILSVYRDIEETRRLRHRVEHASVIRPDQIDEIVKLGVAVSVQPRFAISDWWAKDRLGLERLKWLYPFKTMATMGVPLGFSTDSPVEPLNPWETVYAAVSREGGEALTVEEALHYYTHGSAFILDEEDELGSLEAGKLADLIIVDRDPLKARLDELREINSQIPVNHYSI